MLIYNFIKNYLHFFQEIFQQFFNEKKNPHIFYQHKNNNQTKSNKESNFRAHRSKIQR